MVSKVLRFVVEIWLTLVMKKSSQTELTFYHWKFHGARDKHELSQIKRSVTCEMHLLISPNPLGRPHGEGEILVSIKLTYISLWSDFYGSISYALLHRYTHLQSLHFDIFVLNSPTLVEHLLNT